MTTRTTRRRALQQAGAVLVSVGVVHVARSATDTNAARSAADGNAARSATDTTAARSATGTTTARSATDITTAQSATDIVAVRVWPSHDYTRVTLESGQSLTATHQLHKAPDRLSIDIDGLELTDPLRELVDKIRPDDPYINAVRIAQFRPGVVRMVFDLRQPVAPRVFTLKPVAAYQHRLVFDLHPTVEADPLLALVRERQAAARSAAGPARDAAAPARDSLDEWIDRAERRTQREARAPSHDGRQGAVPSNTPPTTPPTTPSPDAPSRPTGPPTAATGKFDRLVIVAIDPGHGGEDPGAVGHGGLREKDVVLSVALALRDKLNAVPGFRAFMTRDADYFVPLHERVRKARRIQADLFVSIHADAAQRTEARGASVFALSETSATSATARWLARRENAADAVGGVDVVNARIRKDPDAFKAVLDMSTAAQIKDSLRLGGEVLGQLDRVGDLHKPHVEQAGFAVLKAPDIPSILVETAFISNPREEAKLRDPDYRERLVDALHHGIRRYFAKNPPLARQRAL